MMLCSIHKNKTHLILYNTNYQYIDMPLLHINGEMLQVQKYVCHLGHPIGNENVYTIAFNNALRDIVWRTNYVMKQIGSCTADIH